MKIRTQLNPSGKAYWLAETRLNGRLLLCEANNYKDALHGLIDLLVVNGESRARRRFVRTPSQPSQAPAHQGLFLCPEKLHERDYENPALKTI